MILKFTIPQRLPSLNEYINKERTNRYKAAKMKSEIQQLISVYIPRELKKIELANPVFIIYNWYEPNKKRDKDNISFAKKFINDALVVNGVLKNDGWRNISGFQDIFMVDKDNPRVVVEIRS